MIKISWELINRILVVLGFLVVVIYTKETYKLRKINNDQKDLQIYPLPHMFFSKYSDNGLPRIELENIGNGTALDITIEPIEFKYDKSTKRFEFDANWNNNILKPFEINNLPKFVEVKFYDKGSKKESKLSQNSFIEYFAANGKFMIDDGRTIIISFKDIKGQTYNVKQVFNKHGTSIIQLPQRVKK